MAEDSDQKSGSDTSKPGDSITMPLYNGSVEEEPDFSDPEDFVDNITDEELGDLMKQKPKETDGVESIIVVDGMPLVGRDKLERLKGVIRKVFDKFGRIVNEYYPEEDGNTKAYMFIEYSNPFSALEATLKGNARLDRTHVLSVNLFTDFDKYVDVPDQWEPPEPQPYKDPSNLVSFLLNPDSYDQYSVIYNGGERTGIWTNSVPEPTLVEERPVWTETYVRWSPLGTYLATFHQRGIALWGGEKFKQIMKFSHSGVQYIDFSPCERYLVTYSPHADAKEDPQSIIIWDIRMGAKKRIFPSERPLIWPVFKWSHDDKYFARLTQESPDKSEKSDKVALQEGILSIYETPSFGLLDKKSIKILGIKDISWSPTDNVIAYWVAENKDVPARVTIIEIPSRNELRGQNLFNFADCKMHWQKSGDFLCVKIDRYAKQKKEKNETKYSGLSYTMEIFRMREKDIPIDNVEVKEHITAFAWEPVGSKFCFIHGEGSNTTVSFYDAKAYGSITLIKKFEKMAANHLFWAPCGQFIVLAELRSMTGTLQFIDTNDMTIMGTGDHYMASDVEWDPTGRYVVTAVSFWSHKMDNAYWVWSFQGKKLQKHSLDRFCQLLWRPRPQSLLSADQIRDIGKNLGRYSSQFDAKDRLNISKASKEMIEKRRSLLKTFEDLRKQKRDEYNSQKSERMTLRNYANTDTLDSHTENMEAEVVEFFIKEEIIELEE